VWCKNCNEETNNDICEICGNVTEQDAPTIIYYCEHCNTPLIKTVDRIDKDICPLCGNLISYLCSDLRPVFPEERLLIEILTARPFEYMNKNVWASENRYYIDGKKIIVPNKTFRKRSIVQIVEQLKKYSFKNNYDFFNKTIDTFIKANTERLQYITNEAIEFIKDTAHTYPVENMVISFSGGKDSTVTADLTVRALSNPSLVHIFGDTTLEFPMTIEYVNRFKENNPKV